ncbi:DUF484 family protein [Oceanibaculum pacificum]|uniref:DUF484 family protein n=1 Tax=Oceanibaculum pacificum TaxID=580166 RepID=A0A154W4I8_9PROT|nr:DUF484 family protein [Oceanibaculum pacificum]KZD08383.1 hypothetical protein AUP43_01965 [Oceanibaculum pacificum]
MTEDSRIVRTPNPPAAAGTPSAKRSVTAADVEQYLRRHPDFLVKHANLAEVLAPPTRDNGDGVVDLQYFLVHRLRGELSGLKEQQQNLIGTIRANTANQARVYEAVLAMLNATSFEHFIEIVTSDLAIILDVDAVALCVETNGFLDAGDRMAGVRILANGRIDGLLGDGRDVMLGEVMLGDADIFGGAATLVQSQAMSRLRFSPKAPHGLLVFGSRREDTFHPGLGTELLMFLSRALESCVRRWLDLPAD